MNGNKIIAEFMGLETTDGNYFYHLTKDNDRKLTHHILLPYHLSWDWLMTVVEKIESDERYDVQILKYGTTIRDSQTEIVADISFGNKIDHTYNAVVKFIKEYI